MATLTLRCASLMVLVFLAACTSEPRYSSDSAPSYRVTPDQVAEAVPLPEDIVAAGNSSPYTVLGGTYTVLATSRGYSEVGRASWYGRKFHGRKTANGETYNMYAPTAAHRSLPIPSYVRVTNLDNKRSMIVRVNDRGPFHSNRIIDLSYGAAVKLGFSDSGTAAVEVVALDVVGTRDLRGRTAVAQGKPSGYRYLQVGSFSEQRYAEDLQRRLQGLTSEPVIIRPAQVASGQRYRVRIGPVVDPQRLTSLQQEMQALGFEQTRLMPE